MLEIINVIEEHICGIMLNGISGIEERILLLFSIRFLSLQKEQTKIKT